MDNRVMGSMVITAISFVNYSEDPSVNKTIDGSDNQDQLGLEVELDYWALPIFIIFITCGVFGNFLVCLAISTNRYHNF